MRLVRGATWLRCARDAVSGAATDPPRAGDAIAPWEFSPLIGGVGTVNDVELRFADSVFQVVLNGQRVATIVDASFGFGGLAWVVGSHPTASRVVLQAVAAWRAR